MNTHTQSATTAPIEAGNVALTTLPEFMEVRDVQRLFGLRRTMTFNLIRLGQIKSVLLRQPGAKAGKRLVYGRSVQEFLLRAMSAQNTPSQEKSV